MTREEAIIDLNALKFILDNDLYTDEIEEALDTAISALQQSDHIADGDKKGDHLRDVTKKVDTISRQAAIDAILAVTGNSSVRELYEHVQEHELSDMWSGGVNAAIDIIIAVPSVQPEQRWIPVAERLPEEYGEYICTMENGQVQECGFVPENQRGLVDGWSTCEADGHKSLGYADVLAWMPLPKPWKEGEEG